MSKGWPMVRLGELLLECKYGTSEPCIEGGTVPVVGIPHVKGGRVSLSTQGRASLGQADRAALLLRAGDILVTRTNSPELVGQAGIVAEDSDSVFASYLIRLRVDTGRVVPEYLNYWLNSLDGQRQIRRLVTRAVCQANVNPTELRKHLRVPLPSLDEQQKIAGILATWDHAIAVTGQLIEAKRLEMIGLLKATAATSDHGATRLGDLCTLSRGSGLSKGVLSAKGSHPCILYGELHTWYGEVLEEVRSRTDDVTSAQSECGDVLIPSSSETTADLANATALSQAGVLLGGDINILRPRQKGEYDSEYLAYYLTHMKRDEISRLGQGNSVVHLYGRDMARLKISLPGVEQQASVASALATGRREIAALGGIRSGYVIQRAGISHTLFGQGVRS